MALDLTATGVFVPHPDPDKAPLPAMPLLFIMTADYKLEAWSIISTGADISPGAKPALHQMCAFPLGKTCSS